jgi:hypothetical protein
MSFDEMAALTREVGAASSFRAHNYSTTQTSADYANAGVHLLAMADANTMCCLMLFVWALVDFDDDAAVENAAGHFVTTTKTMDDHFGGRPQHHHVDRKNEIELPCSDQHYCFD